MIITIKEIQTSLNSLSQLQTLDLPVKVSYWIKRATDKINQELVIYDKQRIELLEKYAELDKEKNKYNFENNEDEREFAKDLEKVLNPEIELEINPIKISELGDIKIKPELLVSWLFEE